MSGRKRITTFSELTQPDRSKRFARRNSVHTLTCRQGSLKKLLFASQEHLLSAKNLQTSDFLQNPQKGPEELLTQMQSCKDFPDRREPALKRGSISMKVEHNNQKCPAQRYQLLCRELDLQKKQTELASMQWKKYKLLLEEEKEKRKEIEEEVRCNKQEIKRLEKRLQKYKGEKEKFEIERNNILKHIEQLQDAAFSQQAKEIYSYRLKCAMDEVSYLREQLNKDRTQREADLQNELDRFVESKYRLEQQLKAANICKTVLSKQLQQWQQEVKEIQQSFHRAVTESYEYQQLREKYRIMLIEFKELREEMSLLQRNNHSRTFSLAISHSQQPSYEQY